MVNDLVVHGLSGPLREQAVDQWRFRRRAMEPLLSPFWGADMSLRLTLDCRAPRCEAHAVLLLPTGTLAAKGLSSCDAPQRAVDEAADRLVTEIHAHKAMLRREFLHRRRRRRRADLSAIVPALESRHALGDRETFVELLRPALRELSDHARRELVVAQLEGVVAPGGLSVRGLLSELVTRAWDSFEDRPRQLRLELWMTGLLHEILDQREKVGMRAEATPHVADPRLSEAGGGKDELEPGWPPLEALTLASIAAVPSRGSAWERASDEEQRAWILFQLSGFPRVQRRAFALYVLEGWSDDEIAAVQRRSPEDVLLDVERVRDALEARLRDAPAREDPGGA